MAVTSWVGVVGVLYSVGEGAERGGRGTLLGCPVPVPIYVSGWYHGLLRYAQFFKVYSL